MPDPSSDAVRLAVIGDTHLGRPKGLCHRDAVAHWVGRVVDTAVERGCRALLFAGDFFDRRSVSTPKKNARVAAAVLADAAAKLPVALVWGNHDLASGLHERIPEIPGLWVAPTAPAVFSLGEVDVVAASVERDRDDREITDALPAPVRPTVGLLHTSLDGFADTSVSLPAEPAELKSTGYRAWAFGHVHKQQLVHEDPLMLYPGAPWKMREPGFVELKVPLGEGRASASNVPVAFAR